MLMQVPSNGTGQGLTDGYTQTDFMRAALASTRANVCIYDLDGNIRYVNRAWHDKFSNSCPGQIPTHVSQVRAHWEKFLEHIRELCRTGDSHQEVAYLRQREIDKYGLFFLYQCPIREMPDSNGELQYCVSWSVAIDTILKEGERHIIDLHGKATRHKKRDPKVPK